MATKKDYYEVLGVTKNSSDEDIKKAYRNLAREHHPDMVGESDKQAAEHRFKEINEAYQVLSDPQKRKMYDQFGTAGPGFNAGSAGGPGGFGGFGGNNGPFTYTYTTGGNAGNGGFGDMDPFDIFEDFFGFRGFTGNRAPRKGKNLYYELRIEFKDAIFGMERMISIETGKLKVKIPAGVYDGTEIKYEGKGMPGPNGAPSGDLYLTLRLQMPKQFERYGDTLVVEVEIDIARAALGGIIEVPVVDLSASSGIGTAKLKLPSGTQPGMQFRVKGKGMPKINSNNRGDVVARVIVKVPTKLGKEQKKLLEEYMRVS